jgi:hypothetical protein
VFLTLDSRLLSSCVTTTLPFVVQLLNFHSLIPLPQAATILLCFYTLTFGFKFHVIPLRPCRVCLCAWRFSSKKSSGFMHADGRVSFLSLNNIFLYIYNICGVPICWKEYANLWLSFNSETVPLLPHKRWEAPSASQFPHKITGTWDPQWKEFQGVSRKGESHR